MLSEVDPRWALLWPLSVARALLSDCPTASVTVANEIYLGNSAITSIGGIVNWTATSDGRFKKNVQEDVPGLIFIEELRPVRERAAHLRAASRQEGC